MYRVIQEYVAIHEMGTERKSTCSICVGGPGRLPAPSPRSVGGAVGWGQGAFIWRVILAGHFGGSFWRVILAGHFGAFIWQVFTSMIQANSRKEMYNQ